MGAEASSCSESDARGVGGAERPDALDLWKVVDELTVTPQEDWTVPALVEGGAYSAGS